MSMATAPAPPPASSSSSRQNWSAAFAGRVKNRELKKRVKQWKAAPPAGGGEGRLLLRVQKAANASNAPHANDAMADEVLLRMAPYVLGGGGTDKVTVSMDPFVAFPLAVFLEQQGVKIRREPKLSASSSNGNANADEKLIFVPTANFVAEMNAVGASGDEQELLLKVVESNAKNATQGKLASKL